MPLLEYCPCWVGFTIHPSPVALTSTMRRNYLLFYGSRLCLLHQHKFMLLIFSAHQSEMIQRGRWFTSCKFEFSYSFEVWFGVSADPGLHHHNNCCRLVDPGLHITTIFLFMPLTALTRWQSCLRFSVLEVCAADLPSSGFSLYCSSLKCLIAVCRTLNATMISWQGVMTSWSLCWLPGTLKKLTWPREVTASSQESVTADKTTRQ